MTFFALLSRLAALVLLIAIAPSTAAQGTQPTVTATNTTTKHFCFTIANLLPGASGTAFTNCINATGSTCTSGLVSAAAVVRVLQKQAEPTFLLTTPDQFSAFVQMHPFRIDTNMLLFKRIGVSAFTVEPSLVVGNLKEHGLIRDAVIRPINSVLTLPSEWPYAPYMQKYFVDPATGIGFVVLSNVKYEVTAADWKGAMYRALEALAKQPALKHVGVVDWNSQAFGLGNFLPVLQALQELTPIRIDFFLTVQGGATRNSSVVNGTRLVATQVSMQVRSGLDNDNLLCIDMVVDAATNAVTSTNVTNWDLTNIAPAAKDAVYFADVAFVQSLADQAKAADPVVGYTVAMPLLLGGTMRLCHSGLCPQGYMVADALRWKFDTDIAMINAGGPRGPGWPAGQVQMSNLYGAFPFTNYVCRTPMLGITVWEMLNYSMGFNLSTTFQPNGGNALLIPSGMRVRYGNHLTGGGEKIIQLDVLNRTTKAWEPLDRLRRYVVATTNYECQIHPWYTMMHNRAKYAGESVPVVFAPDFMQKVAGEYLTATTGPSTPWGDTEQRFVDVPVATQTDALNLVQFRTQCRENQFWNESLGTCVACPPGRMQPVPGSVTCEPISPASDPLVIAIVVPIAVVLVVVAVVLVCIVLAKARSDQRDVANAPKEGKVTFLFTDIQDSTMLWSTVPLCMNECLDKHHAIIRELVSKHKGYEVKTAGDSFMIAFGSEAAAVTLAMDLQRRFQSESWPPAIDRVYKARGDYDLLEAIDDDVGGFNATVGADPAFNGLRVRVGIHSGHPNIVFDDITKGYDYYGSPVNIAARIEATACGGQVNVSSDVVKSLPQNIVDGLSIRSLGQHTLKGINEPVEIFELLPTELRDIRHFLFQPVAQAVASDLLLHGDEVASSGGSDSGSQEGENGGAAHSYLFLANAMRAMPKDDAKRFRHLLMKAWRVEDTDPDGVIDFRTTRDVSLARVARRITLSSAKLVKKGPHAATTTIMGPNPPPPPMTAATGGDPHRSVTPTTSAPRPVTPTSTIHSAATFPSQVTIADAN